MSAHRSGSDDGRLTVEEFERLPPDDGRTELVRGQVVREPPAGYVHGRRGNDLAYRLTRFVRENELGIVVAAETGFVLSKRSRIVRAPDIAFIAAEHTDREDRSTSYFPGAPDLAVEIMFPGNTHSEMDAKIKDFLDAGTRLIWVLYPRDRTVGVYRPGREEVLLQTGDVLIGEDVLPGFKVSVGELFAE